MQDHPTSRVPGILSEVQAFAGDIGDWARGRVRRLNGAEQRALAERFATWTAQGSNLHVRPRSVGSAARAFGIRQRTWPKT